MKTTISSAAASKKISETYVKRYAFYCDGQLVELYKKQQDAYDGLDEMVQDYERDNGGCDLMVEVIPVLVGKISKKLLRDSLGALVFPR